MAQPDIIMFALPRWDQPISSPAFSLACEFAKKGRVFYIEHPYSIKDVISKWNSPEIRRRKKAILLGRDKYFQLSTTPPNLIIVYPSLSLPINFLSNGMLYSSLSNFNDKVIFKSIRNVISKYNISNWIYFNSYDPFFARKFPDDLKPELKVYQSMDDISQVAYTAKHGLRLEEEIIKEFDLILATSRELTRLKSIWNRNTFYHPNAADVSLFEQAVNNSFDKPEEITNIKTRIIGFTGSVEYRTDFELLIKALESHPDKTFVIVGPVYTTEVADLGIDKYKNIVFTGPKNISQLPQYLKFMDVVIIPYKCNILTKSIYPLKINEYLGAGKAVVATNFSDDINSFSSVAYIAESHDQFIEFIDTAISENDSEKIEKRRNKARENTWEMRVSQFWEFVQKTRNAKQN